MADAAGLTGDLRHYLQQSRDAVLRALDGASEYDVRRPVVPSGTNLLGLVKHLAAIEAGYLGGCVGRPMPVRLPWTEPGADEGADMWARADETQADITSAYRRIWTYADAAIAELPPESPAEVPWWPAERRRTTFGHLLVRVVAETAQHAEHADILRETIDGRGGRDRDALGDAAFWAAYVARVQAAADPYRT